MGVHSVFTCVERVGLDIGYLPDLLSTHGLDTVQGWCSPAGLLLRMACRGDEGREERSGNLAALTSNQALLYTGFRTKTNDYPRSADYVFVSGQMFRTLFVLKI